MAANDSAGFLSEIAIAEEATAGTASTVPAVYDYFVGDPGIRPVQTIIKGGGVHKRETVSHAYGSYHMTGNIQQMVSPEGTLGWFLKWAIGAPASSQIGVTNAYSHVYTPDDTLKSFTLWLLRGSTQTVKLPYCVVNTLEFEQAVDEALMMTVGLFGQKESIVSDFGTSTYSALGPFVNADLTVSINSASTGQAAEVFNTRISISNGFEVDKGKVHGSRFYTALVPDKRVITGSFDLYFNDDSEYQRFWGAADATSAGNETLQVPLEFKWESTAEADTGNPYSLTINIPSATYTDTSVNLGGGRIVQTVEFEAVYNSTSEYDVAVTLVNTDTAYADAT